MTDVPVLLKFSVESAPGMTDVLRINCRDKLTPVCRIEFDARDLFKAARGDEILAAFTQGAGG